MAQNKMFKILCIGD